MYRVTCDGFPLLDWRDNDLILADPKISLEVNTVGEGSFTICKNHPHFDKVKRMTSVVEVSDETGVIFRGRATGDTVAFDHETFVDLEGAMAYFNDSIVRPFNFPGDFKENPDYLTADASGERVAFFLGWLIDSHNAQVQDFQKLKLGNVTVRDPKLARSSDQYASTWAMLKAKLFDSSLGGYLCIRYEEDGNYIDYLSEFTETNSQEIAFGENLLDLNSETEASAIYTAIIPFGALGLTLEGLADKEVTDDLVKSGDTLYSKKAVEKYGWIYAPTDSTTWEDIVDDHDLLQMGVEWLSKGGAFLNAIEATAVDLHFTDAQIESLRIYKNVKVHSEPHGLSEVFPLSRLDIDLLHSQNTKITVGKTIATYTEQAALQQEEAKKNFSRLSKTDEEIKLEVLKTIGDLGEDEDGNAHTVASKIAQTAESITLEVSETIGDLGEDENGEAYTVASKIEQTASSITASVEGALGADENGDLISVSSSIQAALDGITLSVTNGETSSTITMTVGGTEIVSPEITMSGFVTFTGLSGGTTTIDGGCIKTGTISADRIDVTSLIVSGNLATSADIPTSLSDLESDEAFETGITSIIGGVVTTDYVNALGVYASYLQGEEIAIKSADNVQAGKITVANTTTGYGLEFSTLFGGIKLNPFGNFWVDAMYGEMGITESGIVCSVPPVPLAYTVTLGSAAYPWGDLYTAHGTFSDLASRVAALEAAANE